MLYCGGYIYISRVTEGMLAAEPRRFTNGVSVNDILMACVTQIVRQGSFDEDKYERD